MRSALMQALGQDAEVAAMGLALVGVVIDQIASLAEVEKALQTPTREAIQGKADQAIFQRRAEAVEKERAIKENELATELELERKQEQLIAQRGDNALAQVRHQNAAEQAKTIAKLERIALSADANSKRITLEAQANADAQRSLAAARLEEDSARHEIWKGSAAIESCSKSLNPKSSLGSNHSTKTLQPAHLCAIHWHQSTRHHHA